MKKRLLSLLLLVIATATIGVVPAHAATTEEVASEYENLHSIPVKMPNELLFHKNNFMKQSDGSSGLYMQYLTQFDFERVQFESQNVYSIKIVSDKNYKYLVYSDKADVLYFNKNLSYSEFGDTWGAYLYKNDTITVAEALERSCAMPKLSNYNLSINPCEAPDLATWLTDEYLSSCYVLVFPENASSLNDLLYKIPFNRLAECVDWDGVLTEQNSAKIESVTTELIRPIYIEFVRPIGYTVKFSYKISQSENDLPITLSSIGVYDSSGVSVASDSLINQHLSNSEGSFELNIVNIQNGTYTFKLHASRNQVYEGSFEITGLVEGTADDNADLEPPVVTFSELPQTAYTGEAVKLQLFTDKPCRVLINGELQENGEHITTLELVLTSNETINYSAISKEGVSTDGSLDISFYTDERPVQVDKDIPIKVVDEEGNKLEQTAVESEPSFWKIGIALLIIGGIVIFVAFRRKKEDLI